MVICVRNCRFSAVIIIPIILLSVRPTLCQISAPEQTILTEGVLEPATEGIENAQKNVKGPDYNENGPQTAEDTESPEGLDPADAGDLDDYNENAPAYENENYEEFYDESEEDACKERTYGRLLLIGSGILLILGLCGIVCFTKKKEPDSSCPSVTTCFRSCKVEESGDQDACVVNFMKAQPELSESESDYHNIPLPLIYEDMGKICNNAEMFIQRCMTSSVKRTYSEPVKTLTSSKTKFRDYFKELAYLKEKQNKECSKHGAVKAFFKEMFKVFKRTELPERKKRQSSENARDPGKETRVKIEDSTKQIPKKNAKTTKPPKKRDSSGSISITSLLLRPKYQCKYYKKEDAFDNYKTRKRNEKEKDARDRRGRGGNYKAEGEKLPLILNQKKPTQNVGGRRLEISKDFRQPKMYSQDTEELIKMCVNTMRQPFNRKFVTLFDQQNMEQFNGLQDVAATMARKMALEEQRERYIGEQTRGLKEASFMERNYCVPSCSRDMTPLKPKQSKEAVETFDLLVKQLYLMTANNRNLQHGDHGSFIVPHESGAHGDGRELSYSQGYSRDSEEEARARMLRKYQELQLEVERLNRSLRQFAADFLYHDSKKSPFGSAQKNETNMQRGAVNR